MKITENSHLSASLWNTAKHGNNLWKGGANYKIDKACSKRQFSNDFL